MGKAPFWLKQITAIFGFVLVFALVVAIERVGVGQTLQTIKDWQPLIGAIAALLAAIWTIGVLNGQRADERMRFESRLNRRTLVARARMPDALSGMTQYIGEVRDYLIGPLDTLPDPPMEHIATLKEVIEHIDDRQAAQVFVLVSWYQVHRARISNHNIRSPYERSDRMVDTCALCAFINRLYGYARNREMLSDEATLTLKQMENAASIFRLEEVVDNKHYDSERFETFISSGHRQ